VIGIEKTEHDLMSPLSAAILENPDVSALGDGLVDVLGELNRAMVGIVVVHESAHKTDDDVGSSRRIVGPNRRSIHSARERRYASGKNHQGDYRSAKWIEPAQERIPIPTSQPIR
jgi:hypothetical protein